MELISHYTYPFVSNKESDISILEDYTAMLSSKAGKQLPCDMASHPRRTGTSSVIVVRILYLCVSYGSRNEV
jgi:hypothetical protein